VQTLIKRNFEMTSNTIEHKVPAKIANLVNIKAEDYKIVEVVGTGVTDYYPSLDDNGNKMSCMDYTLDEILAAKVHRQRLTVRLLIEGNAVSAETFITNFTGFDCLAIGPNHVDVYVPLMAQENKEPKKQ